MDELRAWCNGYEVVAATSEEEARSIVAALDWYKDEDADVIDGDGWSRLQDDAIVRDEGGAPIDTTTVGDIVREAAKPGHPLVLRAMTAESMLAEVEARESLPTDRAALYAMHGELAMKLAFGTATSPERLRLCFVRHALDVGEALDRVAALGAERDAAVRERDILRVQLAATQREHVYTWLDTHPDTVIKTLSDATGELEAERDAAVKERDEAREGEARANRRISRAVDMLRHQCVYGIEQICLDLAKVVGVLTGEGEPR